MKILGHLYTFFVFVGSSSRLFTVEIFMRFLPEAVCAPTRIFSSLSPRFLGFGTFVRSYNRYIERMVRQQLYIAPKRLYISMKPALTHEQQRKSRQRPNLNRGK
jgi:hypothetical protein